MEKIVYDIRPIRTKEQIDTKILSDRQWEHEAKTIDVFVVPNVETYRIEGYMQQMRQFLSEQHLDPMDFFIDKYSNTGLVTIKANLPLVKKMLDETSFVYKINETPKISLDFSYLDAANSDAKKSSDGANITAHKGLTNLHALPEVCVIDSGLNAINPLENIITTRSHEKNMPDDEDYDNHGTSVAFLLLMETKVSQGCALYHIKLFLD